MKPGDEKATHATGSGKAPAGKRRLRGVLVAAPFLAMLVTAWSLEPYASGFGTAAQLGMPACSMLVNTGWPCPTCGMTTSVAAAARGDVSASLRAQPFGLVLAMAAYVLGGAGLVQAVTARDALGALRVRWWWAIAGLVGLFIGWGIVLAVGAASGTLPMR